ncbi:MAG: hypothetical protein J6I68_02365 [Butyrivibrio sp.]|uniref:AarF/UbiB family protein n=1 Tax=Butyrivibrio sp. TaxID=28121 RepID=UPI001B5D6AC0|nr:AarF/UbiB family protein [Butyrivibrio sp.]MBP3782068.1 hypothetical protein [Butyrivibrio sp.]
MLDYGVNKQEENKNIINTSSKVAEKNIEMSVDDLNKDKKQAGNNKRAYRNKKLNLNIINNDMDQDLGDQDVFVKHPVPHISRDLALALSKVFSWKGLHRESSQPVHDAISDLLKAETESEFVDSLARVIEMSVKYMDVRSGHRSILGSGEERKEDIRGLLKEIAVYSAGASSNLISRVDSCVDSLPQQFKYGRIFKDNYNKALEKRFGDRLLNYSADFLAQNDEIKMEKDLKEWGGSCSARAKTILEERQNIRNSKEPLQESKLGAEQLIQVIRNMAIPDTKTLDDYALLSFPGIETWRKDVYNPLYLNMENLIFNGQIQDLATIASLRARMETLRMELDLYDARVKQMAEKENDVIEEDNENKAFIEKASYITDLEKENLTRIQNSMQNKDLLQDFKAYSKIISPKKKVTNEELARRILVAEQNRARKDYFSKAQQDARDTKLKSSRAEKPRDRYKDYRSECNRILNTDYSVLFKTGLDKNGLLGDMTKRVELINMLTSLDLYLKTINNCEEELSEEDKKVLSKDDFIITASEKQELQELVSLGKLYKPYMDTMMSLMNNNDAYSVLEFSDFDNLSDERKQKLLERPSQFREGHENEFRVYEAFSLFKDLSDIQSKINNQLAEKVSTLQLLRNQNAFITSQAEEKRREKQAQKDQFNALKDATKKEGLRLKKRSKDRGASEGLMENAIRFTDPALVLKAFEEKRKQKSEKQKKQLEAAKEALKLDNKAATQKKTKDETDLEGLMEKAVHTEDPALVMEQFRKNEIDRALKKDVQKIIASYKALSQKEAKKGDETEVRRLCVRTISSLSGKPEEEFEYVPTDILVERLARIDTKKRFDADVFTADITKILDAQPDTQKLSNVLVPLCTKKNISVLDNMKIREYSMYSIENILDRYVHDQKSLDQFDTDILSKIALGLLTIDDIDMEDEENPPTKEDIAKITNTSAIILSALTGKSKDDFTFIPAKEISTIMYEAASMMGSEMDISKYVEEQRVIELRKKTIRDGLGVFDGIDKKTAKRADLENARKALTAALYTLSGAKDETFDLIPTNVLYNILKASMADAGDAELLKKNIIEASENSYAGITLDIMGKELSDMLNNPDVSQEMIDYISAEYDICVYVKARKELNIGNESLSRKDFDLNKVSHLHDANLMASLYMSYDLEYDSLEDFKSEMSVMLAKVTGIDKEAFIKMPIDDFKIMCFPLIEHAKDNEAYDNAFNVVMNDYKDRYKSENVLSRLSSLMDQARKIGKSKKTYENNPALRSLKEIAIYYLVDVAGVKDVSEKELEKLPGMRLYTLVYETITREKDKLEEFDETRDLFVVGKKGVIADCDAEIKKIEQVIKETEEKRDKELIPIDKKIEEQAKKTKPGKENKKLNKAVEAKTLLVTRYSNEILAYEQKKDPFNKKKAEANKEIKRYIEQQKSEIDQRNKEYQSKSTVKFSLEREKQWEEEVRGLTDASIVKYSALERQMSKDEWSKDAESTLAFIGDLVSEEPIFDENGKTISKENRTTAILLKNASLISGMLNDRVNKTGNKGAFNEIKKKLSKGGNSFVDSITKNFLENIFTQFEKSGIKPGKYTADDVTKILNGKEMSEYLKGSERMLEDAIIKGEKHINNMISEAADNLFGNNMELPVAEDELLKHIYENLFDKNELEKIYPKYERKLTGKEKLARMRDSVFDTEKGQGKFLKLVIKDYYNSAPIDQRRFMMSYLIKDLKPSKIGSSREEGAAFFASMLKGAGPLMQKLFQGVPENMLMKQFRPALSVVKSDLRDIPPEYVDRQLKQLKQNANDNLLNKKSAERVTKITKLQSLGAASIAQTFLCDVTYEGPQGKRNEQVVVKIMRPDVNLEKLRTEKEFIKKCAEKTDTTGVMLASFNAHYNKIVEELDFNNEVKNAKLGSKAYEGENVRSVKISETIPSGQHYLVMDKAQGVTADRYIAQLKNYSEECLKEFQDPKDASKHSITLSKLERRNEVRKQVADKLIEAQACQKNMEKLVSSWITNALFSEIDKKKYFHHGDLHAGNIMINKDYATVLDYGNCTTLDNSGEGLLFKGAGRVDNIIKMMAAAYKGFSDYFIECMEAFIKLDGKENDYNSLSDKKKTEMKKKLKAELNTVFKIGSGENTGERIFVALLKAQEAGFKLPQEMINFSQCQQRLENSLSEFNNAIRTLRDSLDVLDTMKITDFKDKYKNVDYNPKLLLIESLSGSDDSDVVIQDVVGKYSVYKDLDKKELRRDLRNPLNADKLRQGLLHSYVTVKDRIDDSEIKETLKYYHDNMSKWNKAYKEYLQFDGVDIKNLTDKKSKEKYDSLRKTLDGAINRLYDLSSDPDFTDVLGGMNNLSNMAASAIMNFDQDSWEEFYRIMEDKLYRMYDIANKFENYENELVKAKEKNKNNEQLKKLEDDLVDSLCKIYAEDAIENGELEKMKKQISSDLAPGSFYSISVDNMDSRLDKRQSTLSGGVFEKVTVKDQQGNEHIESLYGEKAAYTEKLWDKILEMRDIKDLSPEQKKELRSLEVRVAKLASVIMTDSISSRASARFELEHQDYFEENTKDGELFRKAYSTQRELQKQYIEARYKAIRPDIKQTEDLKALKEKRVKANNEFLQIYRRMTEKRLRPIYDIYKDYTPKSLTTFVDAMEEILDKKRGALALLLGKDAVKFM